MKNRKTKKTTRNNQENFPENKAELQKILKPSTKGQYNYYRAIDNPDNKIILVSGPAGVGKTTIACYFAAKYLISNQYEKVILTRPAIEACGENFGFLKGDIDSKIFPYLIPIYEELEKYVESKYIKEWKAAKKIEIAPLAFMRGRNLEGCFVIADECQNMSYEQFKMLLTRMHDNSKMILSGDFDQSDLRSRGDDFREVCDKLYGMNNVAYVNLTKDDIVRSKFISEILDRLEV